MHLGRVCGYCNCHDRDGGEEALHRERRGSYWQTDLSGLVRDKADTTGYVDTVPQNLYTCVVRWSDGLPLGTRLLDTKKLYMYRGSPIEIASKWVLYAGIQYSTGDDSFLLRYTIFLFQDSAYLFFTPFITPSILTRFFYCLSW